MVSAANDFNKLDPDNVSTTEVKQAIFVLGTSARALSSSVSKAAGQAQASLESAVSSFQSQLKSAAGKPEVSQQLVALGNAIGELEETSLVQAESALNCNQQGT